MTTAQSKWADWLLRQRFGGSDEQRNASGAHLNSIRDRILTLAVLRSGDSVLDVGCGTGLLGLGALGIEEVTVIFSDICDEVLEHARRIVSERDLAVRCRFLKLSADNLHGIEDCSVDAVVLRSVLIYVRAKDRAFQEFYRILRPGGRLVLCEPLNDYWGAENPGWFRDYDVTPVAAIAAKIKQFYNQLRPERDPMLDFDERTLVRFAEDAGFERVKLEAHAEVDRPLQFPSFEVYLDIAPNPNAPSLRQAIEQTLSTAETCQFVNHLGPLVEQQCGIRRQAICYLQTHK